MYPVYLKKKIRCKRCVKLITSQIHLREILIYFCHLFTASSITPRCPVKSPNWGQCISTAIENAKPYLAKGDFGEGFVVPKMEPLYIKRLGMVSHDVNTTISDLIVTGASDFKVTKIKYVDDCFRIT